jgi:hypothetical protein
LEQELDTKRLEQAHLLQPVTEILNNPEGYTGAPAQNMPMPNAHKSMAHQLPEIASITDRGLPQEASNLKFPSEQPAFYRAHSPTQPESSETIASSDQTHLTRGTAAPQAGPANSAQFHQQSVAEPGRKPGIIGPGNEPAGENVRTSLRNNNSHAQDVTNSHSKAPHGSEPVPVAVGAAVPSKSDIKPYQPSLTNLRQQWGSKADVQYDEVARFSADSQLGEYWVSGIDGSYPHLQPEQLSRYYSTGRTQPFSGDIMEPGVAGEAFRRCSFQKEIIFMCTDVGDIWLEFVFAQILMMQERGYAHILIYMDSKDHCDIFLKCASVTADSH